MSNYICKLNENITRTHIRYNNRYGIALAGDFHTAKNLDNPGSQTKISEDWQIAKESQSSRQVKMNKDESEEEAMRISVKSADYEIIYELNNSQAAKELYARFH